MDVRSARANFKFVTREMSPLCSFMSLILTLKRHFVSNDAGHSDFLDTCIALILFDESEPQDDVVDWIVQLEKKKELFRQQNGVIAVVANKSDLQVDKEPLWRPWMEELEARNIRLFRVSCRTGNGVDEMFNNVISQYCALRIELGARQDYEEATNASPRSS